MSVKSLLSVAALAAFLGVAGCSASDDATSQSAPAASESSTAGPDEPSSPDASHEAEESSSSDASDEESAAEPVVIEIKDFEFHGPEKVAPGVTIMVQNNDRSTHSFTAEGGEFEEVILEGGGATGMFTAPSEPGEYAYVCKFHPDMVDTLVVG